MDFELVNVFFLNMGPGMLVYWRTFETILRVGVVDSYDTVVKLEKWNVVSPLGFRNQEDHQHMPRSISNTHPNDSVTLILSVSWIRFIRL